MFWKSKDAKPKGWYIKETNDGKFYLLRTGECDFDYRALAREEEDLSYVISSWIDPCPFVSAEDAIAQFYKVLHKKTLQKYNESVRTGITELNIPVVR